MICITDLCVVDPVQGGLGEREWLFKVLSSRDFHASVTHRKSTAPTEAMNSQHPWKAKVSICWIIALEFSVLAISGKIERRGGKLRSLGILIQARVSTASCRGVLVLFSSSTYLQKTAGSRVCASLEREEMPHVTLPWARRPAAVLTGVTGNGHLMLGSITPCEWDQFLTVD